MKEIKKVTEKCDQKLKSLIHIVFFTKDRKLVLEKLVHIIGIGVEQVCAERDCSLIEYERGEGHISMLIEYPPNHNISFLVDLLKQRTTYNCWQYDPHYMRINYSTGKLVLWSDGYIVVSTTDNSRKLNTKSLIACINFQIKTGSSGLFVDK